MAQFKCKVKDCNFCSEKRRSFIYHIKNEHKIKNIEDYYLLYHNLQKPKCIICNNNYASWNNKSNEYRKVCSNKTCICKNARQISLKTIKEKYGVDNISQLPDWSKKVKETKKKKYGDENYNNKEKNKQTCLNKYGVDNGSKTEDAKNKISQKYNKTNKDERIRKTIETNRKKYGVDWNTQSEKIKSNIKKNNRIKYGVDHPMQNKDFFENRKKHLKKTIGVEYVTQLQSVKNKIKETNFIKRKNKMISILGDSIVNFPTYDLVTLRCSKCNKETTMNNFFILQRKQFGIDLCIHCTPYKINSYVQEELSKWIEQLGFKVIRNYRIPNSSKEIDIYIPSKNLGIEYNGIYWHSEIYREKDYHISKKMIGNKNGINIINIWEDDYLCNEILIKNKIKFLLGVDIKKIGARKCNVRIINRSDAKFFLDNYHIQGFISSKIYIGLFYNEELISVSSFGRRNGLKNNEWEIFRVSTKNGYSIINGFTKMIEYFKKQIKPQKIITFVDLDWADFRNNMYEKSGFTFLNQIKPGYFYVVGGKRENRQKYQKYKLVEQGYDVKKTEYEIMSDLGYTRIWNCGNLKYELIIT